MANAAETKQGIRGAFARINRITASMPFGIIVPGGMKMVDLGLKPDGEAKLDQLLAALLIIEGNMEGLKGVLEEVKQRDIQQARELRDIHTALAGVGTLLKLALPDLVEQLEQAAAPSLAEANEAHRVRMASRERD